MPSPSVQRTASALLISIAAAVCVVSAADVLADLGVSASAARQAVLAGLSNGSPSYGPAAAAMRKASPAVRVQLVEGAVAWARAYTTSPEFKAAYTALRDSKKPTAPVFTGTPEEELARRQAKEQKEQAESSDAMKKALASMPPDQRAQLEGAMKEAAAAMQQLNTPAMRTMMVDGIRMERDTKSRQYQDDLKKWQEQYPENPAPIIAARLRAFLDTTADVNFDAKLETRNGKLRFVDPSYEARSSTWKACYRLGKEPLTAARTAIGAWLRAVG